MTEDWKTEFYKLYPDLKDKDVHVWENYFKTAWDIQQKKIDKLSDNELSKMVSEEYNAKQELKNKLQIAIEFIEKCRRVYKDEHIFNEVLEKLK